MILSSEVKIEQQGHLGVLTLDRPQALNALTLSMVMQLKQQLVYWQDDTSIHAVVIRASAGKAFCAGGDVRWLYEMGQSNANEQMRFFEEEYRLNQLIHHYPKPYIALMDGITMGGGVGVSLHGSHPVAGHNFVFAMPETSIGFFPDIGASYLLTRCPGAIGHYLGLTGNRLNAVEAKAFGLVKYLVDGSQFESIVELLIQTDLSTNPSMAVDSCLAQFAQSVNMSATDLLQSKVNVCFSCGDVASIFNALAQYNDDWHREVIHTLSQKSPLSLCVTLKQLHKAAQLEFDQCLQMDTQLVKHFMNGHDFYEGVRALLIDKDKAPKWQPASLAEVDDAMVNQYF
jgi:enoyl-CoA hydratase